jgi:hypothetical protein
MNGHAERSTVRVLWQVLFSINTGFAAVSTLFSSNLTASLPFIHLEVYLNHLLGIRQTDFIRGYFTIWIPGLIFAMCIWGLLQLLIRLRITQSLLRFAAGMIIVLCPAMFWTCLYERNGWSPQWPYKTIWGEATLATICLFVFLKGDWARSRRFGVLAFVGHCIFWYCFTVGLRPLRWVDWESPVYGGPFGMAFDFCSLLTWVLYVYSSREHSPENHSR